jgi:hypothetical protein
MEEGMRLGCRSAALWLAVTAAGLGVAPGSAYAREKEAATQSEGGRQRVLRAWWDTVKVDGEDVSRRSEVIFDYSAGAAFQRTYDTDGKLLSSQRISQPRPSAEEIAEAVAIIEADARLGRIVQRLKPVYEGGFVLEEDKGFACGPGTRCLQMQLLTGADRMGLLRWVVVDLTRQAVAYPNFGAVERARLTAPFQRKGAAK